jgi:PAS domain S-box-containing protein
MKIDKYQSPRGILLEWTLVILLVAGATVSLFTGLLIYTRISDAMKADDARLLMAAEMAREILGADYHDHITDANSVSPEQFQKSVALNDDLCRRLDLQCLWSVLQREDRRLVFTSATRTDLDDPTSPCAAFFEEHLDPASFDVALASAGVPIYSFFANEWGAGRMVLVPRTDAHGRTYIHGASVQSSKRMALYRNAMFAALAIGLSVMALVLFPVVILARRITLPIARLTQAADRMSSGDLDVPLPDTGVRELKALARSLDAMRCAVKQQMDQLSESEQRYIQLAHQSRTITWEVNLDGLYTHISPVVEEVLGRKPEDIVGRLHYYDLHPVEGREDFQQKAQAILARRAYFRNLENGMMTMDGRVVWVTTSGMPLFDEHGDVCGYRGADVDITHLKQAQDSLRQQTALVTSLLESIADLVFFKDVNGVYLGCNPTFAEFVGRAREDIIGKTDMELFDRETAESFQKNDRLMLKDRNVHRNDEWVNYPGGGRKVLLDTLKTPYWGPDGSLMGILGISRDVTDRNRVEESLRMQGQLQDVLMEIASVYINLPPEQMDATIRMSLERLGLFVGADRAYLFEYHHKHQTYSNTHEWCADGIEAQKSTLQALPMGGIVDVVSKHRLGETYCISDVSALPPDSEIRREFARQGIQSMIAVPMMENGECLGFVGFDSVRVPHLYQVGEQRLLSVFAQMLVNVRHRRQAVLALQQSEATWRSYIDSAPYGIMLTDETGRFLDVNPAACRITGYEADELIGMHFLETVDPDHREEGAAFYRRAMDGGNEACELSQCKKNGERCWTFISTVRLNEHCVLGFFEDITDRKAAAAYLEMTKQSYLDVINSITEAIYIQDESGVFIEVNEGAGRIYGCSRESLIGQSPFTIAAPGLNDLDEVRRKANEVMQTGVPVRLDFWAKRMNGEVFPKEVIVHKGRFFGSDVLIATARDVSEKKRLEDETFKLQAQLLQAQKMESVGRLAGGIAHDFNNMLGVILGNTELALDQAEGLGVMTMELGEIKKAAQRSADLTRSLLAFARKQTAAPRLIDLNETVEGMLSMLRRLIGENISLVWRPSGSPAMVLIDPSQVDQILANLCVNARDAIRDTGQVVIETEAVALDDAGCLNVPGAVPGRYIRLSVQDTGCGMDENTLLHIFEPFFTTKEIGKGTGLGLAMVYGIIKQNQGFIDVLSKTSEGTRFSLFLPSRNEGPREETNKHDAVIPTGHETILLVEDESTILHLVKRMVQKQGYHVLVAATPDEAILLMEQNPVDIHLLITDVVMPEMNGRDLAKRLQQINPGLKCLFMSGYTADVIAHHGVLDPEMNFIHKPFSMHDLMVKIHSVLHTKAS